MGGLDRGGRAGDWTEEQAGYWTVDIEQEVTGKIGKEVEQGNCT